MSGRTCRQPEQKILSQSNKEITRGLLPFAAGATLIRNQRVFQKGALLNKLRPLFFILFSLFLTILVSSCNHNDNKQQPIKYKVGDIVYLKPDSTKAVINDISGQEYTVVVAYNPGFFANNIFHINQEIIYEK